MKSPKNAFAYIEREPKAVPKRDKVMKLPKIAFALIIFILCGVAVFAL